MYLKFDTELNTIEHFTGCVVSFLVLNVIKEFSDTHYIYA